MAEQAAMVWLLSVVAKGIISVAKQPEATTYILPQSVVPNSSVMRARSARKMMKGSQLTVSRIVRITRKRSSVIDEWKSFLRSQYSPARSVGRKGGLLE